VAKKKKPGAPADPAAAARDAMFEELLATLSAISGSLGAIALRLSPVRKKLGTEGDQMVFLRKLGLTNKVIAGIMASTEGTVSTRLSEMQAKKTTKKRPTIRRRPSGNR
jgi:DNA-binding NarL/FixJ family response regulator